MNDVDWVAEVLRDAVRAIEKAGVPPELRSAGLPEAVRLLTRPAQTSESQKVDRSHAAQEGETPSLEKLAQRLGVSLAVLEDLFYIKDGTLHLIVPSRKIATGKREGTGEIAVLVTAGRQGAGLDDDLTAVSEVRHWANEMGRYDEKHFGEHLDTVDDVVTIIGKGRGRKLRAKWHEMDQLREIITRIAERD